MVMYILTSKDRLRLAGMFCSIVQIVRQLGFFLATKTGQLEALLYLQNIHCKSFLHKNYSTGYYMVPADVPCKNHRETLYLRETL